VDQGFLGRFQALGRKAVGDYRTPGGCSWTAPVLWRFFVRRPWDGAVEVDRGCPGVVRRWDEKAVEDYRTPGRCTWTAPVLWRFFVRWPWDQGVEVDQGFLGRFQAFGRKAVGDYRTPRSPIGRGIEIVRDLYLICFEPVDRFNLRR
jgi:hypothetical protein